MINLKTENNKDIFIYDISRLRPKLIDDEFVEVDKEGKISPSKIKRKKKIVINQNTKLVKAEEPKTKAVKKTKNQKKDT